MPMNRLTAWRDGSPHASAVVTVNAIRLHYLDWGGAGEPLVLIHGLGDSPHVFDELAADLVGRFRVLAYSRRAHGESESSGPYDVDTLTEDLRQFLDRLGIDRAHLAGWSLAGRELTRFAELHPDRVRSLIYLDAAYDRTDPAWRRAFESCPLKLFAGPEVMSSLHAYRAWQRGTWFADTPWPDGAEANIRATTIVRPDGSLEPVPSEAAFSAIVAAQYGPGAYRREYAKITAPALFIVAASWLPSRQGDEQMRRMALAWIREAYLPVRRATLARIQSELPTAEIVELSGGSHMDFVFSHRAEIVAAVRDFVGRRCRRP